MHGTELPSNLTFDHLDLEHITPEQRLEIERTCFNQIVNDKWKGKPLVVPKAAPSFADYNNDLWSRFTQFLGPVQGKRVHELGCGSGEIAVWLALNGAQVDASDVSDESIRYADLRNQANGTQAHFYVGGGEQMPYPDATFDAVTINVALHHMDVPKALREIKRVLKPGGKLVCIEPFIFSDKLQSLRHAKFLQKLFPERRETPTERMLDQRDLAELRAVFPKVDIIPVRSFSSAVMKVPFFNKIKKEARRRKLVEQSQHIDSKLSKHLGLFRNLSRYAIICAYTTRS